MILDFTEQKMKITSVNARAEMHGQQPEPAGDVRLDMDLPNSFLNDLAPGLREAFYHLDEAKLKDMADAGKVGDPDFVPHLRFKNLAPMQKWTEEMSDARVVILLPGTNDAVELRPSKVNNITFEVREGGTVSATLRVQAHPDEEQFGKLSVLVQQEVLVSIRPEPKPEQQALPVA